MLRTTIARKYCNLGRVFNSTKTSAHITRAVAGQYNYNNNSNQERTGVYAATFGVAFMLSMGLSTADAKEPNQDKKWQVYSRKEVEFHDSLDKDIWVTYKNNVYNITEFIMNHPGGDDQLYSVAGQDIAVAWNSFRNHKLSPRALQLLESMKIGELNPSEVINTPDMKHNATYNNETIYDVIIIGAGLSGLQCGHSLINQYGVNKEKILVLEAQDYVGGRVKQIKDFIKGAKIEMGAEFLHGNNTELTKFARAHNEPLREIYCWAHGDGGPLQEPADNGYGLYYIGARQPLAPNSTPTLTAAGDLTHLPYAPSTTDTTLNTRNRLLRYDDKDSDFAALNKALWDLCDLHEDDFDESLSLYDYLIEKKLDPNMIKMGAAGFANTLCSNSYELSLKQAVKWSRLWHAEGEEDEEDGDYTFKNSYSCLVDHLQKDLQIELETPIANVTYSPVPEPVQSAETTTNAEGSIITTTITTPAVATTTSAVTTSTTDEALVTVTTKEGVVYRARKLVVTASPHVINSKLLTFFPALPSDVQDAFTYTNMNPITKVIMKFSRPAWPKDLHGMIMVDDSFLLPEVWFRHIPDEVAEGEIATAYAVGFTTAKYTERLQKLTQEEILKQCVQQLDTVFSHLEQRHMSAEDAEHATEHPHSLPRPTEAYLGGMLWDWQPAHHPYIGGGYCSPRAGLPITSGATLSKAYANNRLFFAGEATNERPGATAHSALETGLRAAALVNDALQK